MANTSRNQARKRRQLRVRKHVHGSPARPRLNVYRSLNEIYAQVIDDEAGRTLAAASTLDKELRTQMKGKDKSAQAKLVGATVAARAKQAGVTRVVFDRGGFRYMGRVKSLAEGAREGGLEF